MAIRCTHCKRGYDVSLFEFGKTIECVCGHVINLQHKEIFREYFESQRNEDAKIMEIKGLADKIAFLIVSTDYPRIDIQIEKEKLREMINEYFPDRSHLYGLIYESRFRRLEEQFRGFHDEHII